MHLNYTICLYDVDALVLFISAPFSRHHLAYNWCSLSFSNTKRRCASCSCSFLEYTSISSMNTSTNLSKNSINTLFIIFMKYAGALVNPNDITVYSYNPYLVVQALLQIWANTTSHS